MVANILLVEDEEALAQFLKQELTYEGYNVSVDITVKKLLIEFADKRIITQKYRQVLGDYFKLL